MTLADFLAKLPEGPRKPNGPDGFLVRCPAHPDKSPSLSVGVGTDGRILLKCFAGCTAESISSALGLKMQELMSNNGENSPINCPRSPEPKPVILKELDFAPYRTEYLASDQWLKILNRKRGFSLPFCRALGEASLIGIDDGCFVIPSLTAGKVTSLHRWDPSPDDDRPPWSVQPSGAGLHPLFIGDSEDLVLIFESQWDAFAYMDLVGFFKYPAIQQSQQIVITRGTSRAKSLQNRFKTGTRARFYIFQQNETDKRKPLSDGSFDLSPAEKLSAELLSILPGKELLHARIPDVHKDMNDWARAGATAKLVLESLETALPWRDPNKPELPAPLSAPAMTAFDKRRDPDNVLGERWLCRGDSCLIIGSSGIGKSSLVIQAATYWATGKPFFGINPVRPLKSVILQAEDNFGDCAEIYQGTTALHPPDARPAIDDNMKIFKITGRVGIDFLNLARELVRFHKADLLWINPLLRFFAGEINSQQAVCEWTEALHEILAQTGAVCFITHHTNKIQPKTVKNKVVETTDSAMYAGAGSASLTNFVRAAMDISRVEGPLFKLRLSKRGYRAAVIDEDSNTRVDEIFIQHDQSGSIAWLQADTPQEILDKRTGRKPSFTFEDFIAQCSTWNPSLNISKKDLVLALQNTFRIARSTARDTANRWIGSHFVLDTRSDLLKTTQKPLI